ncbi:metallophosphoesterase [bacterium]|nr:metallophosphoesterase [bacterium]MCI0603158.1 metallophosphoesterase [bacterium]
MRRSKLLIAILLFSIVFQLGAEDEKSFAFVVVGDTGCGCSGQEAVAIRMLQWHLEKPYTTVLMLGDNIYGRDSRKRGGSHLLFRERFDQYYEPLIKRGVKFYAVLGNHDLETSSGREEITDRSRFNILGKRGYYSFTPEIQIDGRPLISFIALNSTSLDNDPDQVAWLGRTLAEEEAIWKIPFFHHPIYTPPGKHEDDVEIRSRIENVLTAAGVKVTFAGHNHFYARMKPQSGVIHFVSGGGGRSLKTPIKDDKTAEAVESYHFLYIEAHPDTLNFWAVPPTGAPFDTGSIPVNSES